MKRTLLLLLLLNCVLYCKSQVFSQQTLISNLNYPIAFAISADQRFFVTLKGHDASTTNCDSSFIKLFDAQGNYLGNFFQMDGDSNYCYGETGILGICLDADYTSNHYVYFYYNHSYAGYSAIRIVRLTDVNNIGTSPSIILDIPTSFSSGIHVGGNIRCSSFYPGKIFVSIGELGTTANAQNLYMPYGKILCINTDGTIPAGNPFYDDGNPLTGNDDRIFSYGHRNPFDFCISAFNGNIYSSENGWAQWDEVNLIEAGKNYGWPVCEGAYQWNSSTVPCATAGMTDPLENWGAQVPALTGIEFYTATKIPQLSHHLLVADNLFGRIYDCTMGNAPAYDTVLQRTLLADLTIADGLTTLMQGYDSCIYAMKGGFTNAGEIYKLCPPAIGIAESVMENELKIFPNPATTFFNIDISGKKNIKISDVNGKALMEINVQNQQEQISVQQLAEGVYIITIIMETGEQVHAKLMVVRD